MTGARSSEEPTVYKVIRATNDPQAIGQDHEAGLSRAFCIKPGVDIDERMLAIISIRNGVQLQKVSHSPESSLLTALVDEQSLEALSKLEQAIDEVGIIANAAHDSRYAEVIRLK